MNCMTSAWEIVQMSQDHVVHLVLNRFYFSLHLFPCFAQEVVIHIHIYLIFFSLPFNYLCN